MPQDVLTDFLAYPLTYIFISKEDKYLIKVGRSENPYYRLCKFNEQTRKYLNGLEFEPLIANSSPNVFRKLY